MSFINGSQTEEKKNVEIPNVGKISEIPKNKEKVAYDTLSPKNLSESSEATEN